MRKTVFAIFACVLTIFLAHQASAEITLTERPKIQRTVTLSSISALVITPGVLRLTNENGECKVTFAYDGYWFDGVIPPVESFHTELMPRSDGGKEESVSEIVLLDVFFPRDNITFGFQTIPVEIRIRLVNGFADTREKLQKFFSPQRISGTLFAYATNREDGCMIGIYITPR